MIQEGVTVYFKYLLICAMVFAIKPKFTSSSVEPVSGSLVTASSTASKDKDKGVAEYRLINTNTGATCILLKTDALIEVKFPLGDLEEQIDSFLPDKALVDGNCKGEDASFMSISWTGYNLVLNFAKTPGGERWYIKSIQLTVNPDLPAFHNIKTHGQPIKLYHKEMLIPTPVGKSYSCEEVDIDLQTDEDDHPPPGLRGSLELRLLQLQPFMDKGEDFDSAFECQSQKAYRDRTASTAVSWRYASLTIIAVLMEITVLRYF